MNYRRLGRAGVKVSQLCLGCMNFGGKTSEEDTCTIIDRALDAGINFLDTANIYSRGASEIAVGKALNRNSKRDVVVLATKVNGKMDKNDPISGGNHRREIISQAEASLKRLGTDWIDLYQIHRPQSDIPIDETLRALDDLVRSGKVRYIGTSTFAAWQVVESLWVSRELGLNRFVTEQPPYHLLDRRIERELVPMAQTYGIALLPWSPLAGGFLAGKHRQGQAPPPRSRLAQASSVHPDLLAEPAYAALGEIEKIAQGRNCTVSQLALGWCMNQPGITSPIIGPRTMEHLEDNLAAVNVEITAEVRQMIDKVCPPGLNVVQFYDADFGPHRFRI